MKKGVKRKGDMNVFINTRITQKEKEQFEELAEDSYRTPSDMLRILVRKFIAGIYK